MSNAHNEHESAIKTPKQLIAVILAAFLVPIICIVLLVQYMTSSPKVGAGSNSQSPEAIAARIAPVADQGFTLKDANAPKQLQTGEAVYTSTCSACHANGTLGAPKFGDTGAWSPRIAQGYDTLLSHALKGFQGKSGAMPAKGGNADLDDVEVARALVYMANKGGASFKEPEVKAAPAPAAPAATANASTPASTPAATAAAPTVAAAPAADAGKKLFDSTCTACHTPGIAGAPKFGDKAAWEPRIKQGVATLYDHALKGFQGKSGVMPPKGGSSAPDADVKAAVDYIVAAAK
jgi:cytochrome c5